MFVFDSVCDADDEWATDSDPEDTRSEEADDADVSEGDDGDTDSMLQYSGSPETVTYDDDDMWRLLHSDDVPTEAFDTDDGLFAM